MTEKDVETLYKFCDLYLDINDEDIKRKIIEKIINIVNGDNLSFPNSKSHSDFKHYVGDKIREILFNRFGVIKEDYLYCSYEKLFLVLDENIQEEQKLFKNLVEFETIVPISHRNVDRLFGIKEETLSKVFSYLDFIDKSNIKKKEQND